MPNFTRNVIVALLVSIWGAIAVPVLIVAIRGETVGQHVEPAATSITPITSTGATESGLSMIGDAYSVTCTVSGDAVLYKAVYRGSWAVEDTFVCNMTATRSPSRCIFPADRTNVATYNVFKASGTVTSCTAQQETLGQPISRGPGSGGGGGTVTSVGLSMPTGFSVANSPVTGSATLAVTLATQAAGVVLIGPTSGSAAAPTFRSLTLPDVPVRRLWWSPVDRGIENTPNYNAGGDYTIGTVWMPTCKVTVTGCRFRTEATGSRTIRCKLWDPAGVEQRSIDVATSGPGTYTGTFASAYEIATADVNKHHISSIYQTDGLGWTESTTDTANHPVVPFLIGANIMIFSFYNYAAGNNRPAISYPSSYLPAEPVFAERSNC